MTDVTLRLDGDALREATVQAMIGVLTPEVKAKVLENAIQALLKPSTETWRQGKSPIQEAFDSAIIRVANEAAHKLITEDGETSQRIAALMRQTADTVLAMNATKLATRMAEAFITSMRKDY